MAKLLIKSNGLPAREIELMPGTNRIGRTPDNDFQIESDSISSRHCEMVLAKEGEILVRDLGSTNGTFLNRELISEGHWHPGEKLHLGDVELVYSDELVSSGVKKSGLRLSKVESSSAIADSAPAPRIALRVAVAEPVKPVPQKILPIRHTAPIEYKTFFQQLPSAFAYPFKSNGLILLICGTILFVLLDFVGRFSTLLAILAFGYLFLYMQRIVQYSAQGEAEMPGWPEISNWWDDILVPAFLLTATFLVSFGPAILMWIFLDVDPAMKWTLGISLALFGCFYLPMALLAVSMYDSVFALNPLLIIPSMIRIPLEYLVACLMLGVVLGVRLISLLLLDLIPIPLFPTVVGGFFSLYFLALEMRILGMMYHAKRDELNWNL